MIDVIAQIDNVQRVVGTVDASQTRVATITQAYDTTADDLWDACTNPDRIPRWFLPMSGDLRVGAHYQLEGNAGGTIEACNRPDSFAATWEFGGAVSRIEVRLSVQPDGRTLLTLEHTADVADDLWAQFGPGAVGIGWDMAFMGLAGHLYSGAAVDPAHRGQGQSGPPPAP